MFHIIYYMLRVTYNMLPVHCYGVLHVLQYHIVLLTSMFIKFRFQRNTIIKKVFEKNTFY